MLKTVDQKIKVDETPGPIPVLEENKKAGVPVGKTVIKMHWRDNLGLNFNAQHKNIVIAGIPQWRIIIQKINLTQLQAIIEF